MKLKDVKAGKSYWVLNGHWEFEVLDVYVDSFLIYIPFTKEKHTVFFNNKSLSIEKL